MKIIYSIAVLLSGALLAAAEPVKSGPQEGDRLPGQFEPFNVTGTNADEECCLYCKFGTEPSVMIFAKEMSEPLTTLMKKLDELNIKYKKADLNTCAIFCEKGTAVRPALKTLASKQGFKEIILATLDTPPEDYKISKEADVT